MHFVELPSPLSGMRIWGAVVGPFQFIIALEDGSELLPEGRDEWTGYTASYKSHEGRNVQTIRIDGRWHKFIDAEQACRATWRQLRLAN